MSDSDRKEQFIRTGSWPRIVFYKPDNNQPWRLVDESGAWVREENGQIAQFTSYDGAKRFRDNQER